VQWVFAVGKATLPADVIERQQILWFGRKRIAAQQLEGATRGLQWSREASHHMRFTRSKGNGRLWPTTN